MKKFRAIKGVIVFMLAAVFALTFAFAGCKKDPPDVITLSSIQLDTKEAKLVYDLDEDFTTEGLVVNLIKMNETQNTLLDPEPLALDNENLTIDSSAFRKGVVGEYKIKLTYKEGLVTRRGEYTVSVKRTAGVYVEKVNVDYEFKAAGVEISVNDLTVQMASTTGLKGEPLPASAYTVTAYRNGTEQVEVTGGKITATSAGAYQIWVKVSDYAIPGDAAGVKGDYENFVIVNVTDGIEKIDFSSSASGTVTTQQQSVIDHISPTWKFTATFKSGVTKEVSAADGVKIDLNTNKVNASATATATYEYEDCKGTVTTATTSVPFTITENTGKIVKKNFNFDGLSTNILNHQNIAAGVNLTNADLGTDNDFLTVLTGASCKARQDKDGARLEIQGDVFTVEFKGVGTLTISARSTSKSKTSSLALKDAEGNYVEAKFTSTVFKKDDFENTYIVTGDFDTLVFTILKPGVYTICTVGTVMVNGTPTDTNRNTRINAINLVDEQGGV